MKRRRILLVAIASSVLAMALPIVAALYLAHQQSVQVETRRALAMAGELLKRTEDAGRQAFVAEMQLKEQTRAAPCSEAAQLRMRYITLGASFLQAVGYVQNGRLMCSSLGQHGAGIDLGPPAYVSRLGASVWPAADLGFANGKRFLLMERNGYAAALLPESLIDIYLDDPQTSLGLVGRSSGLVLSKRGEFDPSKARRLKGLAGEVFFDGRFLVAVQPSTDIDVAAYAAIPVAQLRGQLHTWIWLLMPIGILVGLGMALVSVYLARQRASLPSVLRSALQQREFVVHYQPIVELESQRIVGVEALLRWPFADGSSVRADLFIPAAEECGVIQQITAYVLAQVKTDIVRLLKDLPEGYVSVNLSSRDLHSEAVIDSLRKLLQTPGVSPENLMVEATEHSLVDPGRATSVVSQIRALGIRVAIDDFGTGFSSLSYLTHLKSDCLKIDRTFVETVGTESVTSQVALHCCR